MHPSVELENLYGAQNYAPLPVVLVKGKGCRLWDAEGREYVDMMSAYSAVSFGHAPERLLRVLVEQSARLTLTSRAYFNEHLGFLCERLALLTGLDKVLPMNTGAEAVETAIKAARRWGYAVKGIAENQARIVVSRGNFHGRTTAIVGFSSEPAYREGFGPFTGGFDEVPFGDAAALEAAITPDTCAFLTEPVQGEQGIVFPPEGWLKQVREICDRHNVLLLLDEVQTGLGRTGRMFSYEHEGVLPDGVMLGKALGGGVFPVSAFVAKREVMDVLTAGSHGSTWGGNPAACAVALEALRWLEEENLPERSAVLGAVLLEALRGISSPFIKDVRGQGLFVALEVQDIAARDVCERLMLKGVLTKDTHGTVLRFAPPLVISEEEILWVVERVREVFAEMA